MIGSHVEHFLE